MKSENDYIAEYIKEKHPSLLGYDYALWKIGKMAYDFAVKFSEAFKSIDWPKELQKMKYENDDGQEIETDE